MEMLSTTTASACCYISHTENILYATWSSKDTCESFNWRILQFILSEDSKTVDVLQGHINGGDAR